MWPFSVLQETRPWKAFAINDGKIQGIIKNLLNKVFPFSQEMSLSCIFCIISLFSLFLQQHCIVWRYWPSPTIPRTSNLCITSLEAGFLIHSNGRRATEEGLTGASGRRGYGLAWGGLVRNHGKGRITERRWAWWCRSAYTCGNTQDRRLNPRALICGVY